MLTLSVNGIRHPRQLTADYRFPYLAHAAMEPLNCIVKLSADACEVWNGEQFQTVDQGNIVAQVAEVPVRADGGFSVDRVVCAVDCGIAVNPDVIRAQMEGGIGFGLTAALYGEITLTEGRVDQSNFTDYPLLRIGEMPRIEVHIVASQEKPSGVGEPAVPVIAPAVANALFAASGQRLRKLPLRLA